MVMDLDEVARAVADSIRPLLLQATQANVELLKSIEGKSNREELARRAERRKAIAAYYAPKLKEAYRQAFPGIVRAARNAAHQGLGAAKAYNPDEPRDDHGRWSADGGGTEIIQNTPLSRALDKAAKAGQKVYVHPGKGGRIVIQTGDRYNMYSMVTGNKTDSGSMDHAYFLDRGYDHVEATGFSDEKPSAEVSTSSSAEDGMPPENWSLDRELGQETLAEQMVNHDSRMERLSYQDSYSDKPFSNADQQAAQRTVESYVAERPDLVIRMESDSVPGLLSDGRFKSQFETSSSGGLFDPGVRARAEDQLFNMPEDIDSHPELRPIYGYATDVSKWDTAEWGDIQQENRNTSQYGNVAFVLNGDLANRTTFTMGDSLGDGSSVLPSVPSPISSPDWTSLSPAKASGADWSDFGAYMEVQVHGGVSVSDINRAIINGSAPSWVTEALDKAGIPWTTQKS